MLIVVNRSELSFEKALEVDELLKQYDKFRRRIESNVEKQLFGLVKIDSSEICKVTVRLHELGVHINPSSVW
ncbi:hypothetical protein Thu_28 [Bacillus phage Thurquoise]|uniref:Uncharacterized protein n=1 Tax=Bacillus phage Deep Blue TaxID=1792245 RepID=A0A140HLH6_9CAUD|nr:hypothetical protein Blue_015 [Bacillus phage Deep Blue]AMO25838.1 hypothetical protein Blue_015 [Bacillus phage Deep Blue]UXQ88888.1 hypothetical protein Thu_28 [Bacillus phage Thurquoise]